jgi:hypothetical protein
LTTICAARQNSAWALTRNYRLLVKLLSAAMAVWDEDVRDFRNFRTYDSGSCTTLAIAL